MNFASLRVKCILGVSIVQEIEGNIDQNYCKVLKIPEGELQPLPHLVFRPEGLLVDTL